MREALVGTIEGRDLGRYGVWTADFEFMPVAAIRDVVQELDQSGWKAIWVPEAYGREAMTNAGFLLSCTENITVVNAIASIWPRTAAATHAASVLLADAYPGRHVLGLGFGDARPGIKPMEAVTKFLDEMDSAFCTAPVPPGPRPRLLAAYGPQMIKLAHERAQGAHTYHVPVEHTSQARELLGPEAFLGVEQSVIFEKDADKARERARAQLRPYFTTRYNIAKFLRLGYTEADIDGGRGSDRLVDDLVVWGDLDTILTRVQQHVEAGADHVSIQVMGPELGRFPVNEWRQLSEALLPANA